MSTERQHPDTLVKYCSSETGLTILHGQSLRWHSPECFGDPFELTSQAPLNFDPNQLLDSTTKLASSMIFAPERPNGDSPMINAIRRWREEGRFGSPEEAHGVLRELLSKMVDYRLSQLNTTLNKWQHYVRNLRVLSLSGKSDNLVNWEHFAEMHQGLALRFNTTHRLRRPRPVIYQAERPLLTSLREQLGAILHNRDDRVSERFDDHYLIRGKHHQQEDEWRCLRMSKQDIPVSDNDTEQWYEDLSFEKVDLAAVIFGLRTSGEVKKEVTALLSQRYPEAQLLQTKMAKSGFQLDLIKARLEG